jgi:hypothetical protein
MAKARNTTGVTIVVADATDPAQYEQFKAWYQNVHGPDIVGTGSYFESNRYENPKLEGKRLVAVHETDAEDVVAANKHMLSHVPKWQQQGRLFGGMKAFKSGTYKRIF